MRNHTKIYLSSLGYDVADFIPSEISGVKAADIHHVICKGMGGDPTGEKDRIENLMALTRREHDKYGDKKQHMSFLYQTHKIFLERKNINFDKQYLEDQINKYRLN